MFRIQITKTYRLHFPRHPKCAVRRLVVPHADQNMLLRSLELGWQQSPLRGYSRSYPEAIGIDLAAGGYNRY